LHYAKEDIPLLTRHFIEMLSKSQGRQPRPVTDDALELMKSFNWTGNVRELHNVVERLLILCDGTIDKEAVERFVKPLML